AEQTATRLRQQARYRIGTIFRPHHHSLDGIPRIAALRDVDRHPSPPCGATAPSLALTLKRFQAKSAPDFAGHSRLVSCAKKTGRNKSRAPALMPSKPGL